MDPICHSHSQRYTVQYTHSVSNTITNSYCIPKCAVAHAIVYIDNLSNEHGVEHHFSDVDAVGFVKRVNHWILDTITFVVWLNLLLILSDSNLDVLTFENVEYDIE